jgi:hypothetical protein
LFVFALTYLIPINQDKIMLQKFSNYFFLIALITIIISLSSCEKDEVFENEPETITFPKLKGKKVPFDKLLNDPLLGRKMSFLSQENTAKSQNALTVQIDTAGVEMIQTEDYKSYTFNIAQDSLERQSLLRNYMLTVVSDSLQIQHLVNYQVKEDGTLDMENIQMTRVYGDSLIPSFLKCVGIYIFEPSTDCYEVECGQGGHHGAGEACKDGEFRGYINCVTTWSMEVSDCVGGGGGGSAFPLNPIRPVGGGGSGGNRLSSAQLVSFIEIHMTLTANQRSFLSRVENKQVALAVRSYLNDQSSTVNNETRQAVSDVIDVLQGSKGIGDLLSILKHEVFNNVIGRMFSIMPNRQFEEQGQLLSNLDPNENLDLSDWQNVISPRTLETYNIVKNQLGTESWSDLRTELTFSQADQEIIVKNNLTATVLSDVKSLVQEYLPQTADEWLALFEIMKPILLEVVISFIPGGGIALDFRDIVNEMSNLPPDYTVVAIAVASILAEFVPWAKVFKIGKKIFTASNRAFRIYKRISKVMGTIVDALSVGRKVRIVDDAVFLVSDGSNGTRRAILAEVEPDGLRIIDDLGKQLVRVADIKRLNKVAPTTGGFINATKINDNALKIKLENPADVQKIEAIKRGDDAADGLLSESLIDDVFAGTDYTPVDSSILRAPGAQGFDNVLIKRDAAGNIEDIVINESKQMPGNTLGLSSGVNANGARPTDCLNCTQMSNQWIDDVLYRMENTNRPSTQNLASEIRAFDQVNTITKTVSGVNRSTGELVIIAIN